MEAPNELSRCNKRLDVSQCDSCEDRNDRLFLPVQAPPESGACGRMDGYRCRTPAHSALRLSVFLLFHLRCITAIVLQEAEADLTPYLRFHAIPGLAFCLNLLNHSGPAP